MAFTLQTWARASVSANEPPVTLAGGAIAGANRGFNYTSADAQAVIAAADYFDDVGYEITTGDWLFAYSTGDNAGTFYSLVNNAGVITTVPFNLVNVVNTANIANLAVTTGKLANGAVTSAKVDPEMIQFATGNLSTADILAMYGAPVELVAAEGANTIIKVHSFTAELAFNNAQFTTGGNVGLQYGNTAHLAGPAASATFANGANVNICAAQSQMMSVAGALLNQQVANTVNQGIFISNDTAAFAAGNSSLQWYMSYSVYTTI